MEIKVCLVRRVKLGSLKGLVREYGPAETVERERESFDAVLGARVHRFGAPETAIIY